jgi:hypothetical protein
MMGRKGRIWSLKQKSGSYEIRAWFKTVNWYPTNHVKDATSLFSLWLWSHFILPISNDLLSITLYCSCLTLYL